MAKRKDFLVGLFVIISIFILAAATMLLRHWDLFNRRNTYYVRFNHVQQLDVGSPVLAFGVNVGSVSNLEYERASAQPIKVTIRLDKSVDLHPGAMMHVHPAQVIGSTTLIVDQVGDKTKPVLPPGSVIIGTEPQGMESVMNEALQGLSKILNDKDTQAAFKSILINLESVTWRMDDTFKMLNEQFVPMVEDLKASSQNLNKLLTDAQAAVARAADNVSSASQAIRAAGVDYSKSGQTIDREVNELGDRLEKAISEARKAIENTQQPLQATAEQLLTASREIRETVEKVRGGEGTLGKLLTDPRPFQQLQVLIDAITQRLTGGGGATSVFPEVQAPGSGGRSAFPKVKTPPGGGAEPRQP